MLKGGTRQTFFIPCMQRRDYFHHMILQFFLGSILAFWFITQTIFLKIFKVTGRKSRTHSISQIMIGIWMAVKAYLWHITWNRQTLLFHSNIMSRQYACDHYCILNTIQKTYTRPRDKSERRDKSMCISIMFFFNNGLVFLDIILSKSEKF